MELPGLGSLALAPAIWILLPSCRGVRKPCCFFVVVVVLVLLPKFVLYTL